jgi:hypothetical protein
MVELEIEDLLFKQVEKPSNILTIKIINLFENRYRINIYVEIFEDNLIKKRIQASYFCHYFPGKLVIIQDSDYKSPEMKKKQRI